jgi:hypothetical protein
MAIKHAAALLKMLGWHFTIPQKIAALQNTAGLIPNFVLQDQRMQPVVNIGQINQAGVIKTR